MSAPVMVAEHVATTATYDQSGAIASIDTIELDTSSSTDDVGITSRTWTETTGDGGSFDDDTAVAPTYTPAGSGPWTFQVAGVDIDSNTDSDSVVVENSTSGSVDPPSMVGIIKPWA